MAPPNTNTNDGQNRNQISGRGGQGRGAPNGSGHGDRRNGCGNNSIAKYSFEGKMKDSPIFKLTITETGHKPSSSKWLVSLFLYYSQIKTIKASMRSSVPDVTKPKLTSCRLIWTPTGGLLPTTCKLTLCTQQLMQNPMGHGTVSEPWNRLTSQTQISRRSYY